MVEFLLYKSLSFSGHFMQIIKERSRAEFTEILAQESEKGATRTLYFERGRWRFTVALGRVYEIIDFRQLWLVKPAPTEVRSPYIWDI
jgi:hypothetical protein